ncbi:MAG TPA: histidine phosphatase family protein [Candidatus Obscuribacterales bacterium]
MSSSDQSHVVLYLIRHGETEWALAKRHTGRTNLPLTERGKQQAEKLQNALKDIKFSAVFTSPLIRAADTARIAGFPDATKCDHLMELDYGKYEGLTMAQIREAVPNWTVWTHPCLGGETLEHAAQRVRRAIALASKYEGNVLLFAHGHILRILTATWLNQPPSEGKNFMLDTTTVSILSHEREVPAIKQWNAPVWAP